MEIVTHVLTNLQPSLRDDSHRQKIARENIGSVGSVKVNRSQIELSGDIVDISNFTVPRPRSSNAGNILTAKGEGVYDWETPSYVISKTDMVGATETEDGEHGLVPAPKAGDQNKYLSGDATWKDVEHTRECSVEEMDTWLNAVDNEVSNG